MGHVAGVQERQRVGDVPHQQEEVGLGGRGPATPTAPRTGGGGALWRKSPKLSRFDQTLHEKNFITFLKTFAIWPPRPS